MNTPTLSKEAIEKIVDKAEKFIQDRHPTFPIGGLEWMKKELESLEAEKLLDKELDVCSWTPKGMEHLGTVNDSWVHYHHVKQVVAQIEQSAILAERKRIDFELRSKEKKHSNRKRYFTDDELYRAVYPEAITGGTE